MLTTEPQAESAWCGVADTLHFLETPKVFQCYLPSESLDAEFRFIDFIEYFQMAGFDSIQPYHFCFVFSSFSFSDGLCFPHAIWPEITRLDLGAIGCSGVYDFWQERGDGV